MKLKEKIHHAMNAMKSEELQLLYEQIQLLQRMKQSYQPRKTRIPIADILQMTSSSPGCWSETVKEERTERV